MNKIYDIVFITNLPAFYKINLYNAIARNKDILVIFTGDTAEMRNRDFFSGKMLFESKFLDSTSILKKLQSVNRILKTITYKELIIGGWDSLPLWLSAFISNKKKNSLVIESSYIESVSNGLKGLIKKLFIKRIHRVYASGKGQRFLALRLGFKGEIIITKGVGIFNIVEQPAYISKKIVRNFIYVGRLSPEKNLAFLIDVFNKLPSLKLHIVGFGPEEKKLQSLAYDNCIFYGAVENRKLSELYQKADVFILPSLSEPWGMVVEEALNNGLPVLVSDKVGCADELVIPNYNGLVFNCMKPADLLEKVDIMIQPVYYNKLRYNIASMNFSEIASKQVNCYLNNEH